MSLRDDTSLQTAYVRKDPGMAGTVRALYDRLSREAIHKILVLRPDNLGDVILFSGALRKIRSHWPNAEITLCVKEYIAEYARRCPHIDRVIAWEKAIPWPFSHRLGQGLNRVARRAARPDLALAAFTIFDSLFSRNGQYDLLLLPVRSPEWIFHLLAKCIQAPIKIGISGDNCNHTHAEDTEAYFFYTDRMPMSSSGIWAHELEVSREYLNFIGIPAVLQDLEPEIWTDQSDVVEAHRLIPDDGLLRLAISPGAAWHGKIFPPERMVAAISELARYRLSCYVFGSRSESSTCAALCTALAKCPNVYNIADLSGRTTIGLLAESLRLCDAVLSVDTATLHIAAALGKPTVGIMGGGHFGRFYPWGDPEINRTANLPMDCYHCNWQCSRGDVACIKEIAPAVIARELDYLLKRLERDPVAANTEHKAFSH